MTVRVEKCPLCGGDAVNRSFFWECSVDNADELRTKIFEVQRAVKKLYLAMDNRQHAGQAQSQAIKDIEKALGMSWRQGYMLEQINKYPVLASIYNKSNESGAA